MPLTSRIRRQGGVAIVTLPTAILKELHADVGSQIELEVQNGALMARPVVRVLRKRYSLEDLLEGAEHIAEINATTASTLDGDAVGRELS